MSENAPERPSLRDERRDLTQRRMKEAAVEVFAARGYVVTTIDQIARVAGVSRATFYLHFSSKAELVADVWADLRVELIQLYQELAAMAEINQEVLEAWLSKTFDFYRNYRSELLAVHEAIAIEGSMADRYRERMAEVSHIIGPLVERSRGESPSSAELRVSLLTVQHERFCHFWILRGMPFDADEARRTLAQMWAEQMSTTVVRDLEEAP